MTFDLRALARALGGDVVGDKVMCPGPGHSPRDRSLQVTPTPDAPEGFLTHSFAGDHWKDCRDYVRSRLGLPPWEPGDEQDRRVSNVREWDYRAVDHESKERQPYSDDELSRIRRANELWNEARNPRGTLAETYLQLRRLKLDDAVAGRVLRFHPRCPWRNENTGQTDRVPALIAAFRSVDDDQLVAIHRIALAPDGHKIGRRMLGPVRRAAIKLDDNVGDDLAIGEGVETCLAARLLGISPTWALGSVGAISHFPILPGIRTLRIIGENDGGISARAINEFCGPRWQSAGRRVRMITPTLDRKDLNDALGAHAYDGTGR
jgi:putative DNA primase/helicase